MPIIPNVTCPVCGSLCDDIELVVEENRIIGVRKACAMGEAKFLNYSSHRLSNPLIRKDGRLVEASLQEAIKRSGEILAEAKYPILYGWSNTTCEAISVGIELAEEVGGVIDNTSTICHGPSILAVQEVGLPGCTLGQIRHRADLVIYWASNPLSSHPRHLERYTAFSEGRFQKTAWRRYLSRLSASLIKKKLQRAANLILMRDVEAPPRIDRRLTEAIFRMDRRLIVVDSRRTRSAQVADYFLQVEPNHDYEVIQALRMLIRDEELEAKEVAGIPVEMLEDVADIMTSCKAGVIFFGLGLTMSEGKNRNIEAALCLVRELNKYTKFLVMPMRGHYNVTGANMIFTWQTGYPYAIDFSKGYPRYNPGETSVIDILNRGDSDAALIVASDPVSHFPKKAVQNLIKNPLIVVDPQVTPTSLAGDVVIPSAFSGIEAEGTAYRMDHVPLPMKKVVEPPEGCLPDVEILKMILNEVRRLRGG